MDIIKPIGCVLLILVSVVLIQRYLHPKPFDEQTLPLYGVGQVLADQTAKIAHDKGQVVLICQPSSLVGSQSELEGFQKTLSQHAQLKLKDTKKFKLEETRMGQISFEQFAAVVNEHADADVIVCMLGLTSFTAAQVAFLPQPCPKLVVADWSSSDVQRGIGAGCVKAAVVNRHLTSLPTDNPKTPREWFDRYYELVTTDPGGNSK